VKKLHDMFSRFDIIPVNIRQRDRRTACRNVTHTCHVVKRQIGFPVALFLLRCKEFRSFT